MEGASTVRLSSIENSIGVAPLLLTCDKTVSELYLFEPPGLLFERKQIPQIVVVVRIQ